MAHNSTTSNLHIIVSACESISKSGITPTVALVKKHAFKPLPLPEIISVLKKWKEDPNQYPNADVQQTNLAEPNFKKPDEIIQSLEARIDKLERQMVTLLKSQE